MFLRWKQGFRRILKFILKWTGSQCKDPRIDGMWSLLLCCYCCNCCYYLFWWNCKYFLSCIRKKKHFGPTVGASVTLRVLMSNRDEPFIQWTLARLHKGEYHEFMNFIGDKRHPSHPTAPYTFPSLSPHSWASRLLDGWRGCWGWGGGSWVTFLPSGLCVCQPGHSQFSPGKLGGKNFLYASILDTATTTQRPVCTRGTCVCVYMCDAWNWAPSVIWLACYFLTSTLWECVSVCVLYQVV